MKYLKLIILLCAFIVSFFFDVFTIYQAFTLSNSLERQTTFARRVLASGRGTKVIKIKITDTIPKKNLYKWGKYPSLPWEEEIKYDIEANFHTATLRWWLQDIPKIGEKIEFYPLKEDFFINPKQVVGLSSIDNPSSKLKIWRDIFASYQTSGGIFLFISFFVSVWFYFKNDDELIKNENFNRLILIYIIIKFISLFFFT